MGGGIDLTGLKLSGGQLSLDGSLSTTSDGFLDRLDGVVFAATAAALLALFVFLAARETLGYLSIMRQAPAKGAATASALRDHPA